MFVATNDLEFVFIATLYTMKIDAGFIVKTDRTWICFQRLARLVGRR